MQGLHAAKPTEKLNEANGRAGQGLFPVDTDNSFEYVIQESGFDDGWIIRVIGYFHEPGQEEESVMELRD